MRWRRAQSGQHHLSFQSKDGLLLEIKASVRSHEQAPHRVAGGGKTRARHSRPLEGRGLCAAGDFIEQRPCRRAGAVTRCGRDVGEGNAVVGSICGDIRRHHSLYRGVEEAAAAHADDARVAVAFSGAAIHPVSPERSQGCRAAKLTAPIWRSDRATRRVDGRLVQAPRSITRQRLGAGSRRRRRSARKSRRCKAERKIQQLGKWRNYWREFKTQKAPCTSDDPGTERYENAEIKLPRGCASIPTSSSGDKYPYAPGGLTRPMLR